VLTQAYNPSFSGSEDQKYQREARPGSSEITPYPMTSWMCWHVPVITDAEDVYIAILWSWLAQA
jgi:hypothetical protein